MFSLQAKEEHRMLASATSSEQLSSLSRWANHRSNVNYIICKLCGIQQDMSGKKPANASYKYKAPAMPTAGPRRVVGMRALAKAAMGPPRMGIFFTAPLAMCTAKMPPIMNKPKRFPLSSATRFSTSLANPSNCWIVSTGWSVRVVFVRIAPWMSSWAMGRSTNLPHFGSNPSHSLCMAKPVHQKTIPMLRTLVYSNI